MLKTRLGGDSDDKIVSDFLSSIESEIDKIATDTMGGTNE